MSQELINVFENRAKNHENGRTRKAIEDNIIRYLKELHANHFRFVPSGMLEVKVEHEGAKTRFTFNFPQDEMYQKWDIVINILPFMRNYDEWMKGGNEEWKNHVKPWSR